MTQPKTESPAMSDLVERLTDDAINWKAEYEAVCVERIKDREWSQDLINERDKWIVELIRERDAALTALSAKDAELERLSFANEKQVTALNIRDAILRARQNTGEEG